MGANYFANPLAFILESIIELYAMVVLLRFVFQWHRMDFHNPVSQFVLKATNPLLRPLRKVVPGFAGQDVASLVLILVLLWLKNILIQLLFVHQAAWLASIWFAMIDSIVLLLNLYLFTILVEVIMSWVTSSGYNPLAALLYKMNQPVLGPVRRAMPDLGGIDLSPLIVLLVIQALKMLVVPLAGMAV